VVAADTNVLVRLLTGDDARQAARAEVLFRGQEIWLAKTVLLESEWVLRRLYHFPGDQTVAALRRLTALPNVRVEHATAVAKALDWAAAGLDLADAMHLASRDERARFASFDKSLVKRARRAGIGRVDLL
jgi:predicted nucleic-acid-binding protein